MEDHGINKNFNILYTSNYQRAFMLVKRYIHDEAAAEDIVSDVMIKLWQMMQTSAIESEEAMLYTMLRNASINFLKHKQAEAQAVENVNTVYLRELELRLSTLEDNIPNLTTLNEINRLVQLTLSQLPSLTRNIFKMSRYENKSNKDISEYYHISTKAVEYHITRAIRELRKQLKDYLPFISWSLILFFI